MESEDLTLDFHKKLSLEQWVDEIVKPILVAIDEIYSSLSDVFREIS